MNLQTLRDRYRDDILRLAEEHKLENIRVFGSIVRGEADEDSDVDLLVHPKKGCSLLKLSGFHLAVQDMIGRKVDVAIDLALKKRIAPYVLNEAVEL